MALDFPASPIDGQAYGSYIYNATIGAWQSKEDPATVAVTSTTAPASANNGDIWYNTNTGVSYVYYNDGTSAQWVEVVSSAVPALNTKANLAGDNSFSGGVNYFGAGGTNGTFISSNSGRAQFTVNNVSLTPLTVRGTSGQTVELQLWQDSTGTSLSSISSNGAFTAFTTGMSTSVGTNSLAFSRANTSYIDNTSVGGTLSQRVSKTISADTVVWNSSVNGLSINPSGTLATTATPLTVKGTASQTADLQQWQNSGGTVLTKIDASGNVSGQGITAYNYSQSIAGSSATVPSVVKGAASQTADLQQWQDSSGTAKSWVDSTGRIFSVGTGTQTTVAASNELGGMAIRSTSSTAAAMSFHVPALIATNIGVQPDQKFSIGGWSLPADSLTIDTAGRMRVPNQPSFNVTNGGAANGVSTFIYTTINHNTGNHYNSSNGRFTAPVAGLYFFEATVGNGADFYVDLSVNGNIWRRAERRNGSASIGYFWIPMTMVIKLNAGDYVSVICNYGTANSTSPYAGFSGTLIG